MITGSSSYWEGHFCLPSCRVDKGEEKQVLRRRVWQEEMPYWSLCLLLLMLIWMTTSHGLDTDGRL